MKRHLFIAIALVFSCSALSQMGVNKKTAFQVSEIKERPLLVVDYGNINDMGDYLKKAIEEVWTISPTIKYVTKKEWRALSNDINEVNKYAYLYYATKPLVNNAPSNSLLIGLLENKMSTHYAVIPDLKNDGEGIVADLMFALKNLQTDLEIGNNYDSMQEEQTKVHSKYLKDSLQFKTLYLEKDKISIKFLRKIGTVYKYDFELVDQAQIQEAILNKTSDVLFLKDVFIGERPESITTKTNGVENTTIESPGNTYLFLYRASDLELLGSIGFYKKEIGEKDIKNLLTLIDF